MGIMINGMMEFKGIPEEKFEVAIKRYNENKYRGNLASFDSFVNPIVRRYVVPLAYVKHLAEIPFDNNKTFASVNGVVIIQGPSFDEIYGLLEQISLGTEA